MILSHARTGGMLVKNSNHSTLEMILSKYVPEKERKGRKRVHFFLDFFRS